MLKASFASSSVLLFFSLNINHFFYFTSPYVFDDPGKQSLEGFTTFRRWVEVGIWLEGYSRDFVSWRYPSYIKWKMQVAEGKEKNSKERTRRWNAVSRWVGLYALLSNCFFNNIKRRIKKIWQFDLFSFDYFLFSSSIETITKKKTLNHYVFDQTGTIFWYNCSKNV